MYSIRVLACARKKPGCEGLNRRPAGPASSWRCLSSPEHSDRAAAAASRRWNKTRHSRSVKTQDKRLGDLPNQVRDTHVHVTRDRPRDTVSPFFMTMNMGWDGMGRDYESCKTVAAAVRVCGGLSVHLACSAQAAAAAKSCAGRPPRKEFRTTASKGIEGPGPR